jgi:threonyl-tRNA synthetase
LPKIEQKMAELAKRSADYERIEISWDEAIDFWKKAGDEYKLELLEGLKEDEITFYKQGNFIDLCRGTHIPNTSLIKAIKLYSMPVHIGKAIRAKNDDPYLRYHFS